MSVAKFVRQSHRWISMLFIACVLLATYAAATGQDTASPLYYAPLPPLFLLMASGLFLFILPYAQSLRARNKV